MFEVDCTISGTLIKCSRNVTDEANNEEQLLNTSEESVGKVIQYQTVTLKNTSVGKIRND